jgi:hypothetical protein
LPIVVLCCSLAEICNGIQTTFLTVIFYLRVYGIHKLVSVLLGDSKFQMQIFNLCLEFYSHNHTFAALKNKNRLPSLYLRVWRTTDSYGFV